MNKCWIALGALGVAVLVAALALTLGAALPDALAPWRTVEEPLAVSFRPLAELAPPQDSPLSGTGVVERRALAVQPEEPVESAAEASARCAVEARVVDGAGNPLAGAFLRWATPQGPAATVSSAADGRARLELQLQPGQRGATLEAGCRGFASRSEEVRLSAGETVDLGTLALEPGGGVRGLVVDPAGSPIAGALVTLDSSGASARDLEAWRYVRGTPGRLERIEVPLAVSGADGEFRLSGLPQGLARLWAQTPGRVPSYTPPIEVRAGQESYGVQIVLPPLESHLRIAGVVLEPAGAPVPHAALQFEFHTDDLRMTYAAERRADAAGRFEFMLPPDALLAITALDPQDRWGPASAADVRTGGPDLVLRLSEGRAVRLVARGADGAALDAFDFEVLAGAQLPGAPELLPVGADVERLLQRGSARPGQGPAVFRLPEGEFVLRVSAALHRVAALGPLSPAATGEELELRLEAAPGLTGVVHSEGGPLAGAQVSLHALIPDDVRLERNGFRCWVEPEPTVEAESDGQGRFVLTVRSRGAFLLRAEHDGLAAGELGPLELDPRRSPAPVELRLGPGGAIAGRLVPPLGEDATGRVVAVDRGDGQPRRKRVGPDGSYLFEVLTPGSWRVEALEEEQLHTITQRSPATRSFEREVRWSCTVREGETTRFDLVQADLDAFLLAGHVELEGVDPTNLIAWLCPTDLPLVECFDNPDRWPKASPGANGRFELGAPEPGAWRLVVKLASARAEWVLIDELRLSGARTEWELGLGTGSVTVEGLPTTEPSDEVPPLVYRWEDEAGHLYLRLLVPDESGTCTLEHVPAGEGSLVRLSRETMLEPERWPVALTCEVTAGELTRIAAP